MTGDPAECFLAGGVVVHNCGNKAARTNLRADEICADLSGIMDSIFSRIASASGARTTSPWITRCWTRSRSRTSRRSASCTTSRPSSSGRSGAGNHYVDLFDGDEGWVWIGVHFGSRGFGHRTASGFLALAEGLPFEGHAKDGEMDSPPVLFHIGSELGQSYIAAMELAGRVRLRGSRHGRREGAGDPGRRVDLGGPQPSQLRFRERHFDTDVWVDAQGLHARPSLARRGSSARRWASRP